MAQTNSFPYLSEEDISFAKVFRLSEDTVLKLFGGLHGYKLHELRRKDVKTRGHTVKPLPSELTKGQLEAMERFKLTSEQVAQNAVDEQVAQVQSLLDLEVARRGIEQYQKLNK